MLQASIGKSAHQNCVKKGQKRNRAFRFPLYCIHAARLTNDRFKYRAQHGNLGVQCVAQCRSARAQVNPGCTLINVRRAARMGNPERTQRSAPVKTETSRCSPFKSRPFPPFPQFSCTLFCAGVRPLDTMSRPVCHSSLGYVCSGDLCRMVKRVGSINGLFGDDFSAARGASLITRICVYMHTCTFARTSVRAIRGHVCTNDVLVLSFPDFRSSNRFQ